MDFSIARNLHNLIVEDKWIEAANQILKLLGQEAVVKSKSQAIGICRNLFQFLLDNELYLQAATLQWGPDIFTVEPESVKRVFEAMHKGSTILLMGASSMGKTYGAGAWMLLDYLRDPLYTTVKLAAVNEDHLKKNLFAHVVTLFRACVIPPLHDIVVRDSDLWMGVKDAGNEFGISGIAFKQSQETSGQFKGYKAKPVRKIPHPKFGYMSRLRVLGDEGQNWPGGPFKDFNSLVASKQGSEMIKVAVAFNPESTAQLVVQKAEPMDGWNIEDIDKLYDYESREGWMVCRLDAARSENVIQKKMVFMGLQTYEGFLSYLKAGGDNSPNYFTFARGWPPMKGSVNTIIPPSWPQEARGECTFIENPIIVCAVDLAFMGQDSAQMAVGRWGLSSGWRDHTGKVHVFKDRLNIAQDKPRHVLQVDQILPLEKHDDTVKMAEEIMGRCKMLGIKPEHVAVDKTSIGLGTWSHLNKVWGDVLGISWNEKATEGKMLAEDKDPANKICDGLMSEMWWAFRRWLDPRATAILINPIIPTQPIHTQLTARRFRTGKNGIKVEPKEEYKARNQHSPDEADALVMLVHLIRKVSDVLPGLVEQSQPNRSSGDVSFVAVTKLPSIESDDSISLDGKESDELVDV
jgi:hypothetical protein